MHNEDADHRKQVTERVWDDSGGCRSARPDSNGRGKTLLAPIEKYGEDSRQ